MKRFIAVVSLFLSVSAFSFAKDISLSFEASLSNNINLCVNKNDLAFLSVGPALTIGHLYLNGAYLFPRTASFKIEDNIPSKKYGGASGAVGVQGIFNVADKIDFALRVGACYLWTYEIFKTYNEYQNSVGLFFYEGFFIHTNEKNYISIGLNACSYVATFYLFKFVDRFEYSTFTRFNIEPKFSITHVF